MPSIAPSLRDVSPRDGADEGVVGRGIKNLIVELVDPLRSTGFCMFDRCSD